MKKFLAPLFGIVLALGLFGTGAEVAFGQAIGTIIDSNDRPVALGNDSFAGSGRQLILTYLNFALIFLGLVAVAFVIYAGFLYVTSAGDDGAVEKGKKILIYAAIGIIVVLASYAIVNTLLASNSGDRSLT